MGAQLSPRVVGRLAGLLLLASGLLSAVTLPLPQPLGINKLAVLAISIAAVLAGTIAIVAPWQRWGPRASLTLLPLAFALIAAGDYYGNAQPYTYSIFFIVAFVWLGVGHPRWTSIWFIIPATVAYLTPIVLRPHDGEGLSAVALVMPVCVFVAETIAWVVAREVRSRQQTTALASVATALGPQLNVEAVYETLTAGARVALGAELTIFVQLNAGVVKRVFSSGLERAMAERLTRIEGVNYANTEDLNDLSAGKHVVVEDTQLSSTSQRPKETTRLTVRSYLAVPVMVGDDLAGVLTSAERSRTRRYDADDITLARALASQASAALRNAILYEQTLQASRADPLTGLGNRRAFHERLESEVDRTRRYARPLSLVVLDVDWLKAVNDSRGHRAGDRVLERVALLLKQSARRQDGVYRLGGDEFAVVLPETDTEGASVAGERMRKRVERGCRGLDEDQGVTVSVGISSFPEHGINPDELFERADNALYEVKRAGRNAVATATTTALAGPGVRFGLNVSATIEDHRLRPMYQPIVNSMTGAVIGYEALSRLDPVWGTIAPTATLFRAAASLGLTEALDRECRRTVLAGAHGLPRDRLLFLNTTPASLQSDDFDLDELVRTIHDAGLLPEQIVLEITEQERSLAPRLDQVVIACRDLGVRVALDDFGTNLSDLDRVAASRFDYVKIDTGLLPGVEGEEARRRFLQRLLAVSADADVVPVAEGIETLDDLKLVREIGYEAVQGYFIGDPAPSFSEPRALDLWRRAGVQTLAN